MKNDGMAPFYKSKLQEITDKIKKEKPELVQFLLDPVEIILKTDISMITQGKIIYDTLGVEFNNVAKSGRTHGPNKRSIGAKNEIGVHAIRAGDIVGDQTILFAGPGERIELKHQAHSRACFASGGIKAVKFITNAKENKIYEMNEVLNL